MPQPIPAGALVHLRAGLYAGPLVLGEGTRLEGSGEVVLTGEAGQTVVTAEGASLEGLSIQGGAIGLEAGPSVGLTHVHFSGQRKQAAVVHGQLSLKESQLEASVEGIDGVVVERGATFEASNTKFTGGFRVKGRRRWCTRWTRRAGSRSCTRCSAAGRRCSSLAARSRSTTLR